MENKENLKYQKRAWHKMSARILSTSDVGFGKIEVVVYKGKRQIRFTCFTKVKDDALKLPPHQKISLWFKIESKLNKGRWFNELHLMHFECPKVKSPTPTDFIETTQDEPNSQQLFKFGLRGFE